MCWLSLQLETVEMEGVESDARIAVDESDARIAVDDSDARIAVDESDARIAVSDALIAFSDVHIAVDEAMHESLLMKRIFIAVACNQSMFSQSCFRPSTESFLTELASSQAEPCRRVQEVPAPCRVISQECRARLPQPKGVGGGKKLSRRSR